MTKVLQYAQSITDHRDHAMVDTAMVYSLIDMLGSRRRRFVLKIYRVSSQQDALHFTLSARSDGRSIDTEEIDCGQAVDDKMTEALQLCVICAAEKLDEKGRVWHFTWVPVQRSGELLGCIEIGMSKPLSRQQLILIDGMRGLYANYLSLLQYSQVDTLTQLLNRKTFDHNLHQMLALATARTAPPDAVGERRSESREVGNWLGVMDIDHFKRVNDTYGHLFGDEVLILVANTMRKVFRRKDRLFRFGGEEFVVLLRDADEANALKVFERFRAAVEAYDFPQVGHVSISIGITRVQAYDTPSGLLGRADDALYYAKRHGRNQLRVFEKLLEEGKVAAPAVAHGDVEMF